MKTKLSQNVLRRYLSCDWPRVLQQPGTHCHPKEIWECGPERIESSLLSGCLAAESFEENRVLKVNNKLR